MRLYLRGIWVEFQSQSILHKRSREVYPIELGECEVMGIVVADCPIELARDADLFEVVDLIGQSVCKIGEFFSQSSRGGWLTVSVCQHSVGCPDFAFCDELLAQRGERRLYDCF